jgi:hypothetical protein
MLETDRPGATTEITDPSSVDQAFAEMLARVQSAPCHRMESLAIQEWWAEVYIEAARFRRLLCLETRRDEQREHVLLP